MTRALLFLSVLCSGCLVVPAKKVTTKPVADEFGSAKFAKTSKVELSARSRDGILLIHAIRHGECTRPVYKVTEVTTERKAAMGGAEDPRAMIFGALLAPVTIPLSAIYTGLVVAGDTAETSKNQKLIGTQHYQCSAEAEELAVTVTLPSGEAVAGFTNVHGDTEVSIPASEGYEGNVTLSAEHAEPTVVSYQLPKPAVRVAREAITACATKRGITGPIETKLSVNDSGRVVRVWMSLGDVELQRCVATSVADVVFPEKAWQRTVKLPVTVAPAPTASL
jgi:hypothetical protein